MNEEKVIELTDSSEFIPYPKVLADLKALLQDPRVKNPEQLKRSMMYFLATVTPRMNYETSIPEAVDVDSQEG